MTLPDSDAIAARRPTPLATAFGRSASTVNTSTITATPARRGFGWLMPLVLVVAVWFGWPAMQTVVDPLLYGFRLVRMPAPQTLPVPVQGVRAAALRDTWGGARSGGRWHEGIDIFARRNTPVLSATEGIVSRVGTNSLGGKVVWVLGPAGHRHYYAHLNDYAEIRVGQRVQAGSVLGYVGDTGNARGTPPHLHYGIYTTKGAVNPYPFLKNG